MQISAQHKPAYQIFKADGSKTSYGKMLNAAQKSDIVFFGELHDNPICHYLEYELARDLFDAKKGKLIIGAEMFEADNQLIMDEYLSGIITEAKFEDEMRLWPNYKTGYKKTLTFAKDSGILFVATNIPRRYASVVYHKGFEGLENLSEQAKAYLPPLPIPYEPELSCYAEIMDAEHSHLNENLPKAQAVKDAAMAHFISRNMKEEYVFLHINGAYHSDNKEGIIWYLEKAAPDAEVMSISTVYQEEVSKLDEENLHKADFIIVSPASMTTTH